MIKNVPDSIISALDQTCGGIVCAEVICGDYDREEVWKYLVETTNKTGNKELKRIIIERFDGDFPWGLFVGDSEIEESEYDEMLDDGGIEDTTFSFDFEKILSMKHKDTDDGFFVTTNNGRIQDNENDYNEIIKPAYNMLKKKFPGIKYMGMECYVWSDVRDGEPIFAVYGDGKSKCKEVERYLKSNISKIDFDECSECFLYDDEKEETISFLIENKLCEQVEKLITLFFDNVNCCEDYLSSEEFDDAIHTLCKKKQLSYELSMKMIGHDRISTPMKAELLEYVHKNFPDRDVMSEYSID